MKCEEKKMHWKSKLQIKEMIFESKLGGNECAKKESENENKDR